MFTIHCPEVMSYDESLLDESSVFESLSGLATDFMFVFCPVTVISAYPLSALLFHDCRRAIHWQSEHQ